MWGRYRKSNSQQIAMQKECSISRVSQINEMQLLIFSPLIKFNSYYRAIHHLHLHGWQLLFFHISWRSQSTFQNCRLFILKLSSSFELSSKNESLQIINQAQDLKDCFGIQLTGIIISFQRWQTLYYNWFTTDSLQDQIFIIMSTLKQENTGSVLRIASKPIDITFQNIRYSLPMANRFLPFTLPSKSQFKDKAILKGISGVFKAGQLSVILGASGAGKTTLLNILASHVSHKKFQGTIMANGKVYNYENFGDFANYVTQADVLLQTLTVRQTLEFAASLKLNLRDSEKQERIKVLCRKLKLQKCLDVLVGGVLIKGISSGERKRTSIAFELISDPQVLMLDEPTSGLDSLTSFIIVRYLKKLAQFQGKTIIMTIHQPSSEMFNLFDRLFLLVQGRLIFQGCNEAAREYFAQSFNLLCPEFTNPADYFMSIMHQQSRTNKIRLPLYFQLYEKNIQPKVNADMANISHEQIQKRVIEVSFNTSFRTLVIRECKNLFRNPLLVKARIMQTIFMAVFTGGLFWRFTGEYTSIQNWHSLMGFYFFLSINLMLLALAPVQLVFPSQREVFLKEESAKLYTTSAYFLSRNIIDIPYSIIFPLMHALILYWFVGLSSTFTQFATFYLICYLISFIGMSLGLMFGSTVIDSKSINAVCPTSMLPLVLVSGLFKNAANLPTWIGWLQYLSPVKYAYQAFLRNELLYESKNRIDQLHLDFGLWKCIGLLLVLGITIRMATLLLLWLLRTKLE